MTGRTMALGFDGSPARFVDELEERTEEKEFDRDRVRALAVLILRTCIVRKRDGARKEGRRQGRCDQSQRETGRSMKRVKTTRTPGRLIYGKQCTKPEMDYSCQRQ